MAPYSRQCDNAIVVLHKLFHILATTTGRVPSSSNQRWSCFAVLVGVFPAAITASAILFPLCKAVLAQEHRNDWSGDCGKLPWLGGVEWELCYSAGDTMMLPVSYDCHELSIQSRCSTARVLFYFLWEQCFRGTGWGNPFEVQSSTTVPNEKEFVT